MFTDDITIDFGMHTHSSFHRKQIFVLKHFMNFMDSQKKICIFHATSTKSLIMDLIYLLSS